MKNKNFIFNVLIMSFIFGFVSCGDSAPPVFEKGKLMGDYLGNCTVSLGSASEVVSNFPAEFRQKDAQNLYLSIGDASSYESIGISTIKTASAFKDYGSYAGFVLESMNVDFGIDQIPSFIKNNISLTWDMGSATLKLNTDSNTPPKYTVASKNLTFTYTGVVEITGKNVNEKYSSPVTYKFSLNKQ